MALAVGAYVWPEQDRLGRRRRRGPDHLVNIGGLERTAFVTRILLVVSLAALAAVVIAAWTSPTATSLERITPIDAGVYEMLQSAGLLFFAFAGYARIATLGEEVKTRRRRSRRRSLGRCCSCSPSTLVVGGHGGLGCAHRRARRDLAPLRAGGRGRGRDALAPMVRVGAAIAALGVLLNLVPGVSRTTLAMARRRELPGWFAHVDERRDLPLRAETTVVLVVGVLVSLLGLRSAIAISGTAILTYYAITNASALTLTSRAAPLAALDRGRTA
jgi:basic amino acid/polyamine antiporter, APA family